MLSLLVVVSAAAVDCKSQRRCRDEGGEVERYNYRTVWVSCGDFCTMPQEISDWRCVMPDAKAEKE